MDVFVPSGRLPLVILSSNISRVHLLWFPLCLIAELFRRVVSYGYASCFNSGPFVYTSLTWFHWKWLRATGLNVPFDVVRSHSLACSWGRTIAKTVKFDLHILHSFRPDMVIVQLSTDDLTSCPPLQVGSAMEDFVHLLHDSYGVKCVYVCQTIRRRSAVVFNQRADILTRYLRVVLEPIPFAIYWGHTGFWRSRNSFLFFFFGIHLNRRGQYKFYRSLRGAVLKSLRAFTNDGIQ